MPIVGVQPPDITEIRRIKIVRKVENKIGHPFIKNKRKRDKEKKTKKKKKKKKKEEMLFQTRKKSECISNNDFLRA